MVFIHCSEDALHCNVIQVDEYINDNQYFHKLRKNGISYVNSLLILKFIQAFDLIVVHSKWTQIELHIQTMLDVS